MERAPHRYSPELKQRPVAEIEEGIFRCGRPPANAQTSETMIQKWVEEYGRYQSKRNVVEVVMDQIAALMQVLAEAHLKLVVYDELIVPASKHFKTDLKKLWYGTVDALCHAEGGLAVGVVGGIFQRTRDANYKRGKRGSTARQADAVVLARRHRAPRAILHRDAQAPLSARRRRCGNRPRSPLRALANDRSLGAPQAAPHADDILAVRLRGRAESRARTRRRRAAPSRGQ